MIIKRFNDFLKLDKNLKNEFKDIILISCPPKSKLKDYFCGKYFFERRKFLLINYLNFLLMNKKIKNSKFLNDFLNGNSNSKSENLKIEKNNMVQKFVQIFTKRNSKNLEDIEFDKKITHYDDITKNIEKMINDFYTNLEILKNDLEHLKKINETYYDYSKENIKEIKIFSKFFFHFKNQSNFNKLYNNYNKIFSELYKRDNYSKLVSDYNNYLIDIIIAR